MTLTTIPAVADPRAPSDATVDSAPCSPVVAISAVGLGKCHRIYAQPVDRLKQALSLGRRRYYREFWALHDVSFDVHRGETVGIIGRNGCGKSTLLQLVCGTLRPTLGRVAVQGRIAALLELGAGFNAEFTGRENVYTNAAILGLSRCQIDERYKDIVAFAELDGFMDQPVKTYSSGMYVRLAFAVASSVEPDILVIDEALAVGDEAFQRKCFARIEAIQQRGGTILFVSHDAGAVVRFCNRALLLEHGDLLAVGAPKDIVTHYHRLLYAPANQADAICEEIRSSCSAEQHGQSPWHTEQHGQSPWHTEQHGQSPRHTEPHGPGPWHVHATEPSPPASCDRPQFDPGLRPSSLVEYPKRGAEIVDPHIETLDGHRVNVLVPRESYVITYRVRFHRPAYHVHWGTLIKTIQGVNLSGMAVPKTLEDFIPAGSDVRVAFHMQCQLTPGVYFANSGVFGVVDGEEGYLHRMIDALMFRVMDGPQVASSGPVDLFTQWQAVR